MNESYDYSAIEAAIGAQVHPAKGYFDDETVKYIGMPVPQGVNAERFRKKVHQIIETEVASYDVGVVSWVGIELPPEELAVELTEEGPVEMVFIFSAYVGRKLHHDITMPHMPLGEGLIYPLHTNN